jgi:hypothetical protein
MRVAAYSLFRRDLMVALAPLLLGGAASLGAAVASGRFLAARLPRAGRRRLGDRGTSELEFAMAFPVFLMTVLVTIQIALLINATLVVDYAAFAAARSAAVWVPEAVSGEPANVIGNSKLFSPKWGRIQRAAMLSCLPLSPRISGIIAAFIGQPADYPAGALRAIAQRGAPQPNAGIDYAHLAQDFVDKWPYTYAYTSVELVDAGGRPRRQFDGGTITAQVTYDFYLNVPFAGRLLGTLGGGRRFGFGLLDPFYMPIEASYTLQSAQGG